MPSRWTTIGVLVGIGTCAAVFRTSAQSPDFNSCTADMYNTMAQEQRVYRSVLLGLPKAEHEPLGSVRHLNDKSVWMKTQKNTWKSLVNTNTLTDMLVDGSSETDRISGTRTRRGIFEIRHTSTSELIPALTQSIRAFQCRLAAICLTIQQAPTEVGPLTKVQPAGCMQMSFPTFTGCAFTEKTNPALPTDMYARCLESADALLSREISLLEMTVAYDAGYRSLLQFAGAFENFTNALRFPLLRPLWDAATILGQLDRIPCFISQCD
ncbi:hypothetical protein HYZ98_05420 [Candidatus Peregrinibacteria bacterium]|nr:hypothetical protein [Candidatus Peregrinibacteria bacterium]